MRGTCWLRCSMAGWYRGGSAGVGGADRCLKRCLMARLFREYRNASLMEVSLHTLPMFGG